LRRWAGRKMAGKIFINYRRGDDPGTTGRLFDRLQIAFGPEQLFLDIDSIAPGLDFVRILNERVAESDVVLAVIGKGWIDARDSDGARRLDDPHDFVLIEISSALAQGKRVIPVLVGEAKMPRPNELPEAIRPLVTRNAVRLTYERFNTDTQGLIKALQKALEDIETARDAEAARRAQVDKERKRQREEAERRAEEERRRKQSEIEWSSIRPEPLAAAMLLAILAVLSAFISAGSPWIFAAVKIFSRTTLPPPSFVEQEAVPLLPATWFAIVVCTGMFLWGSKNAFHLFLIFIAVLLGWVFAWESVAAIFYAFGETSFLQVVAGIVGGCIISSAIAAALSICSKDFRAAIPITSIILTGSIIGSAFYFARIMFFGLLPVYILWQPAVAAVIAYFIVLPKAQRSAGGPFKLISRREILGLLFGCLVALVALHYLTKNQALVADRENTEYQSATDNLERLENYVNNCQLCVFKLSALQAIDELRENQQQQPHFPPATVIYR
jgi:hypothetical protein